MKISATEPQLLLSRRHNIHRTPPPTLLALGVLFPYNPPLTRKRGLASVGSSVKPAFYFAWILAGELRTNSVTIEERIRGIAERAAVERGLEIVHVETARGAGRGQIVVRIFIDKPVGITHEDCVGISHHVGTILDVEDPLPDAYTLEVSSPGLERGLYKLADYERFTGHPAKLKTDRAIGNQRNFRGRIIGVEGDAVVFDDRTSKEVRIPFAAVAKANLEIDTEAEFKFAAERAKQSKQKQRSGDTENEMTADGI